MLLFHSVVSPAAISPSACVPFSFVSFFLRYGVATAFVAKLQKKNKQEISLIERLIPSSHPVAALESSQHWLSLVEKRKFDLLVVSAKGKSRIFRVHRVDENGGTKALEFYDFPPGCVVNVSVYLNPVQSEALIAITDALLPLYPDSVEHGLIKRLINDLSLADMNWLLYCRRSEENAPGIGRTPYYIPRYDDLIYCGLQGIVTVMRHVAQYNDMGHSACGHLREGLWFLVYQYKRISIDDPSKPSNFNQT
ncbi:hypothetical protein ACTXT7_002917 [Hymenolepis weldensis]